VIHVRRHQRQLASGKTVAVRQHERNVVVVQQETPAWDQPRIEVDDPRGWTGTRYFRQDGALFAEDPDGSVREVDEPGRLAPHVLQALDEMKEEMREWRNSPEPYLPPEPMTPQMVKLMGCDTPEGREKYERLRAYRESGYKGPLGSDNRIPDPDDPGEQTALEALAHMRASRSQEEL